MNEEQIEKLSRQMLRTIVNKRSRVQTKYDYYEAEQRIRDLGISMPARLLALKSGVGWASKAVDVMADRLTFDAFENDRLGMNELYQIADENEAFDQAKQDSLIAGCSFIAIVDDPTIMEKRFMPFNALEATGVMDASTGLLKYGLAITHYNQDEKLAKLYHEDSLNYAKDWVVFAEDFTAIFENRRLVRIVRNVTGRSFLHVLPNRPTTKQPFGRSVISRECRLLIQSALRTLRRSEVAAEFYSMPQRYLLGVSEGFEKDDGMDLAFGKIATIEADENGQSPTAGQWNQQSMSPHGDHLKMFAQQFCAKTSLTLHQLGFDTENPTSSESFEAQHEDLRIVMEKTAKRYGVALKKLAITLRLAKSGSSVVTPEMRAVKPHWESFFKVDIGPAGDAINKITQVMPELKQSPRLYYAVGLSVKEAEKAIEESRNTDISAVMSGEA